MRFALERMVQMRIVTSVAPPEGDEQVHRQQQRTPALELTHVDALVLPAALDARFVAS